MKKLIAAAVLIYLYFFNTQHGADLLEKIIGKAKQPLEDIENSKERSQERNDQVIEDAEEALD